MNRRALGWLMCLGAPGVATGLTLTMFYALSGVTSRVPHFISLGLWATAAVISAVGGYLSTAENSPRWRRVCTAAAGCVFGAGAFLLAMVTADGLASWF